MILQSNSSCIDGRVNLCIMIVTFCWAFCDVTKTTVVVFVYDGGSSNFNGKLNKIL